MKKISKLIITTLILIINSINLVNANFIQNSFDLEINKNIESRVLLKEDIFIYFGWFFNNLPKSYKYINLKYKNIIPWSEIENAIKKLVYINKIDNLDKNLYLKKEMNAFVFYTLAKEILDLDINIDKDYLLKRNVNIDDLNVIKETFDYENQYDKANSIENIFWDKKELFNDVYSTIYNDHINHEKINKEDLIYWAIEWLAIWSKDIHTVYFPPIKSKNFEDTLSWEYEWIWSYVEMMSPWEVKITSPIPWWPAEKAWVKWWDIILKINWKEITRENSLLEVVSWIKGPAWSSVSLTLNRNWKEIKLDVKREKIIIKNLENSQPNQNTYNIQIKTFWVGVANEFRDILKEIKNKWNVNKIIIDLRNNWGWYLNEASDMLWLVVPEWEKTAVIKYEWSNNYLYSKWENIIDINKFKVIILQNSWTASASEILIWTLKDYFPNIVTIWENTYWKWSVQAIKDYNDWSSLKYTIAKWFTWKNEKWIDGIWFKPDIELEFDMEAYKKDWSDNQLIKAINY